MTDILMPALSPTMEEGTLAKWHVKAGDTVKSGDVVAEIETDKATMEVEAVDEGVVSELLVPEGTEGVKVNAVIARLKGEGEANAVNAPPQSSASQPTATPQAGEQDGVASPPLRSGGGGAAEGRDGGGASEAGAQTSQPARLDETAKPEEGVRAARDGSADETREAKLQGEKAERQLAPERTDASGPPPSSAAQPPPPPLRGRGDNEATPPRSSDGPSSPLPRSGGGGAGEARDGGGASRVFASPLARRVAQQKGVDLSALKGAGPHGRIIKADVDSAQPGAVASAPSRAAPAAPQAAAAVGPAAAPADAARAHRTLEQLGIPPGSYDLVPLDAMKRTIARRMTDSAREVPHFPLTIDLEIDALLTARAGINKRLETQGVKVSVNDLVIKCAALALKDVPDANASYTPEGIAHHHHADVAVAVAVDGGLITPIVREAESRGLADIARTMKDLAERARTRKLKPEEYLGGTFTISNLGMFGIRQFSSIINEPQGMILSVGAGEKRPVVRGDQLAVATVMTVTLTCDHRVVDGAIGARWLTAFRGFIEDPITMLA